ncbi:beta-ketoacyl-ACP synthase [Ideonella paludis]|uniref:Beta-ketoacyl-ACP synthase n=1 Tax=Ideonella paludis TaxID=1233411 RepID=A0ABS5DS42_9BURK|nr:beta-ketoacyl-ACP synthase [Ideonella paludis]MBQ0933967.1 beta-ketoacyl-ACP synthase [Ideonella paludis]
MSVPVYLHALGLSCALGSSLTDIRQRLFAESPWRLSRSAAWSPGRELPLGVVCDALPAWAPEAPARWRSRTNQLLRLAMASLEPAVLAARERYGAHRVAVILGSSTSGVAEGEKAARARAQGQPWPADFDYAVQEMANGAAFVAQAWGLTGPVHALSTACSSAPKAMASAARLLRMGLVDAVVTGGADALCELTVAGFSALDSVSDQICQPLSVNRHGINIGEGAGLFLMSREPGPIRLAGWGETSDAHHMSAPHPQGRGAIEAMQQALARAGVGPQVVDYVNLHATATAQNDAMESLAVQQVLGTSVPVSGTKPLTGHALAAAGAVEAGLCILALTDNPRGHLPPHWWDGQIDPALPALTVAQAGDSLGRPLDWVMSHSFAFGGSNAVLLLARD